MEQLLNNLVSTWWGITILCVLALALWLVLSAIFYRCFFKRFYDIVLSAMAILLLSPILLILTILGVIKMKGNPFFTQLRPGKNEKIFKLIKFRTMTNAKDKDGKLLPDDKRLTRYGKILRSTSLDELPELFNILLGHMSIVGPRPLLVEYLPYYKDNERKRHKLRPGLTGWAQIHGRNNINSWEEKFEFDIYYVENCSLWLDIKALMLTVVKVLKRSDILVGKEMKVGRLDDVRKAERDADIAEKV
ncbi:MAG: sugar transferase [Clostridia bacterium]|nr:sugar transferase [Clostridia bacterium]